jgi:hypothetical protein
MVVDVDACEAANDDDCGSMIVGAAMRMSTCNAVRALRRAFVIVARVSDGDKKNLVKQQTSSTTREIVQHKQIASCMFR